MVDTKIQFAGIELPNPLVLAPGPPSKSYAYVKRAVDAAVGGVVFKTAVPDSLALTRKYPRPRYRLLGETKMISGSTPASNPTTARWTGTSTNSPR